MSQIKKRNLTTKAKYYKSFSKDKKDILLYLRNKTKLTSNNILKYEKYLSDCLNEYKKKSDINNSLYENYKKNYQNFQRINSIIRAEQKPKEKQLILNLLHDYYLKKNMIISKNDMKENIFENSSLLEKSYNRLKMDYLLNYDTVKKEMLENESNIKNKLYLKIASKTNYLKKNNSNNNLNNKLPGIKLSKQLNNLNDVKYMKKVNTIAKSKMLEDDLYKKDINKTEIQNQLEELNIKGNIEQKYIRQKSILNILKDINKIKQNLKALENEESNSNPINILANKSPRGKSLFYIPTLVKTFPELLYDKLNKNKNNVSKNSS